MDIETYVYNNEHIPYAPGYFDGIQKGLFYFSSF